MAGSDPDWWARVVSGLALTVSAATFIWTRLDKRRERKTAERAGLPSVKMLWNPAIDADGWYTLKLTFRDISQGVRFVSARVLRPRGSAIATWNGTVRGSSGSSIPLKWEFHATSNPPYGEGVAVAHLHLRTADDIGTAVKIQLEGRFLSGGMNPFDMIVVSHRD